ncbi:hypothetical protein SDC9_165637 [bioreactor metagenome]|uniref:Uncharacterized protein n=1 Tax=bioreactor metagenome TaxID=1076179 RepID=A0A645FUT7_9ZZZZ
MLRDCVQIILSLLAVFGLFCLGWLLFGRLLAPSGWTSPVFAVIPARGNGVSLEQTVKGLLWLRAGDLRRYTILIADCGLDADGRAVADFLAADHPGVAVCQGFTLDDFPPR